MMEEKQLNFNQPLLSVRRGTSNTAPPEKERKTDNPHRSLPPLPYYKSELKSGPIRNPGVVPFKWEQMPGRPKGENKAQNNTLDCTPLVPKLPPGRTPNHLRKQTDEALRDPPTSSSRYRAEYDNLHSSENSSLDKVISEVEESEKEIEGKYASSSDDENVSYLDARETLSRTESFFNCSVSGVSGLDGPESRGAFLDSQTRDFMMGRFLPAAKAVASETPAFASRRRPAAREQEKPVVKTVKLKNQSPSYDTFLDPLYLSINGDELDEEDDSDEAEDLSLKLCGLMPRFCMLNPIPAMRDHVPVISSARSVRTRPAYAAFGSDNKHKDAIINRGELKRTTNRYTPTEESLMNGLLGRNGMAKEKNALPQLFLNREKQFLGLPGEPRDFGSCKPNLPKNKLDSDEHDTENASSLVNRPADEKTLYVDFESMVESRHSHSSSPESRGRNPSVDSLQDIKSLCCAEEKAISRLESPETTTCTALSTSEKFFEDVSEGIKNMQKDVQDVSIVDAQHPPTADVKTMKQSKMFGSSLGLTPLLPKSPSESWLSRTLPSMPSRNPSSKSYLANHAYRHSPVDPKREELLKSSGAQNMLFLSAGELAPISEN